MSLLPLRGESSADPDEPRVVGLAGEEADETFEVLSSGTTREVLAALYEEASTPSEIRDHIGTSLQNVHYHLGKLEDADLIEPAGVGYSEKGTEMTVYAPTSEAVVLFAGRRDDRSRLRSMLSRVFGVVVALGAGTAALRWFLQEQTNRALGGDDSASQSAEYGDGGTGGGAASGGSGADASGAGDAATTRVAESTQQATSGGGGGGVSIASNDGAATTGAPEATGGTADGGAATTSPDTVTETLQRTTEVAAGQDATTVPQQVAHTLASEPALAFLLGGVFVLCLVGAVWYTTR
ncbi:ArsR/SmtB family transcription factor [Halomarina salina]|uniref:ArsR/SmtB family transcription factor n=1 Tax=Halomarina salina TaxID=1872699 RepID=A0ABD5RQ96_9EURY|nr:helix-turn-helix domain-containing protein [Halomarina salina]